MGEGGLFRWQRRKPPMFSELQPQDLNSWTHQFNMSSSLHPTQQSCSEHNSELSCSSSTCIKQLWILLGELEEPIWHRGTIQHWRGRSSGCTRHPLHQGKCAQAVGHKAEQWCEAHLSCVWERGSALALFVALLHGHWEHPVNSTCDQIQHSPSPQSLPRPGPACEPSRYHSSPWMSLTSQLPRAYSSCWPSFLSGQHRQPFP